MSCGDPHKTPCVEVLGAIYLYIDHEIDSIERVEAIDVHLAECPPCHEVAEAEQRVRELVARCCGCDETPDPVRERVLQRLTEIRFQLTFGEAQ